MSYELDNILYPIFRSAENGNQFWHEDTEIEYKRQIKALMLELVGGDNYAPTGSQREIEAVNRRLASIREKINSL